MKNQRGITLTSLIIYIVLIFVIIVILARVSVYFTSNMSEISKESASISEIDKFNMFFLRDVKQANNEIETVSVDGTSITFTNGTTYEYSKDNNVIYYENTADDKKIIIAEIIEDCKFLQSKENSKDIVTVEITISEKVYKYEYVMGYENVYKTYETESNYINGEGVKKFAITTNTKGVTFTKSDGVTVGDPNNLQNGDIVTYKDYQYTYNGSSWSVVVLDKTKEEYGEIAVTVYGKTITSLESTFDGCSNLKVTPEIPESVTNMSYTFRYCYKLQGDIIVNASPTTYTACFQDAGTQSTGIVLKGSSTVLNELASTNTNGKVTVGQ